MQEPQRLFARLNAVSVQWEDYIRVTGPILGAEAIAAGLAGLARLPYLLMRYLWCLDSTVTNELYRLVLGEIVIVARNENWPCRNNPTQLMRLIKTALHELKHVKHCKVCSGTGVKKMAICAKCQGVGRRKWMQAEYARHCCVDPENWKRSWEGKYQEILLRLTEWNEQGIRHLLSRL